MRKDENEAYKLAFSFHFSWLSIDGDLANTIFGEIKNKVEEIHQCRHFPFQNNYDIPHEAPFKQGDGRINGLPDIIYESENYVLGIEHFEFDASGSTRTGSKMRKAEIYADRLLEEERKKTNKRPLHLEADVHINFSYNGYVQSLLKVFTSHATKIKKYRKELEHHYGEKKIYFAFFIEDITSVGNYVLTRDTIKAMYPVYVKEFLDELAKVSGVDFIISEVNDCYIHKLLVQEINMDTMKSLYKNSYDKYADKYATYTYKKTSHIYSCADEDDM